MSKKTYTPYELTDSQLQRLSAICNNRNHGHGVALDALKRKGLVTELEQPQYPRTCKATCEGYDAMEVARREGW